MAGPARRSADAVVRALLALAVVVGALLALGPGASAAPRDLTGVVPPSGPVEVTLYWGDGCPKCEAEREWLGELAAEHDIALTEVEVWEDADGREAFVDAGRELGFEASAVPTTVVDRRVWIGFTDEIADDVRAAVELAAAGSPVPPGVYGSPGAGTCSQTELQCAPDETGASIAVPLVGTVALDDQSLLVSTLVIGFVDGVNPCSLWVISVLLTIVVRTASRRRVVAIGATFLTVTAAMYALFMAGIYSALTVVGFLGWVQVVVAVAAGVFAVVSIKDYFAFKKGLSFTIADSAKPGIYSRVRRAAGHRRLLPALLATAALGVAVSLLETPCTAGFPVLWTGLLQANGVGAAEAVGLFGAYMVPFLLDELVVFGVAVATMRAAKLQEKHGELLKLFAGVTMLALAVVMVLDPSLMENPAAAAALFGTAFAAALAVHVVTSRVRRARTAAQAADDAGGGTAPGAVPEVTTASAEA